MRVKTMQNAYRSESNANRENGTSLAYSRMGRWQTDDVLTRANAQRTGNGMEHNRLIGGGHK